MSNRSRVPGTWPWLATIVLLAVAAPAHRSSAQASDSIHLRPTSVTVVIENDKLYSGTYNASGVAIVCGHVELGYPGFEKSFDVEFPDEETPGVRSLTFSAKVLPPGSSTGSFHMNVGVRIGASGAPPLYVIRADEPQYNEPGTANLVNDKGATTLSVVGTAPLGVKVTVKAVCSPKPKN